MSLLPHFRAGMLEAGCDEAGRGCLAGPVVAAAVVLPEGWDHPLLNDSKKLTPQSRNVLRLAIEEEVECRAVAVVDRETIDEINILNASILAMHRALEALPVPPDCVLVDGNRFKPFRALPHECIVGGDAKYRSIAAASILAKTYRDEIMEALHDEFPGYGWKSNKGYPTAVHRRALMDMGPCIHHRRSFALLPRVAEPETTEEIVTPAT